MIRMTEGQRDELARMIEEIASAEIGELQLDAALDAIAETVLPDRIDPRYFEAHVTCEPGTSSYEDFVSFVTGSGWRASRFDHDDVDDIAGKWFLSFRSVSYSTIVAEVGSMVRILGDLPHRCARVLRYKIEETLLDSKMGDTL